MYWKLCLTYRRFILYHFPFPLEACSSHHIQYSFCNRYQFLCQSDVLYLCAKPNDQQFLNHGCHKGINSNILCYIQLFTRQLLHSYNQLNSSLSGFTLHHLDSHRNSLAMSQSPKNSRWTVCFHSGLELVSVTLTTHPFHIFSLCIRPRITLWTTLNFTCLTDFSSISSLGTHVWGQLFIHASQKQMCVI